MNPSNIPGYIYGSSQVAQSPISDDDFSLLRQTVLMTDEDFSYLRLAADVLEPQIEAVLDLWYGFVGAHPHLLAYFATPSAQPLPDYLARVRQRFGQWILDTTRRPYDRDWLNYQMEIALRHHSTRKNQTDGADSISIIPLRYLLAFIVPITATIRPFLEKGNHSPEAIEKMHQAWFKSIVLQVILWSYPYTREGNF
jgi:hypothetical protein